MEAPQETFGTEFIKALIALQGEAKLLKPNALNNFTKKSYVSLKDLHEQTRPLVLKHGFAVSQLPSHIGEKSALRTIVMHESGQYLEDKMPIELPSTREEEKYDKELKKAKTVIVEADSQDQGAAITHLRRYAYMAALGLVADDGEASVAHGSGKDALGLKNPTRASATNPASKAQRELIQKLASERGISQEQIDVRQAEIISAADASEAITKLKAIPIGGNE